MGVILNKGQRAAAGPPGPQSPPARLVGEPTLIIWQPTAPFFDESGWWWFYPDFLTTHANKATITLGNSGSGADYADDRLVNLWARLPGGGTFEAGDHRALTNYAGRALVGAGQGAGLTARSGQFGSESEFLTAAHVPPLSTGTAGHHAHVFRTGHGLSYNASYPYVPVSEYTYGGNYGWGTEGAGSHSHTVNSGGGTLPLSKSQPSQAFSVVFFLGVSGV